MHENETCDNLELSHFEEALLSSEENNEIIDIQLKILKMVALDTKSDVVLDALCQMAEKLLPNAVATIMLVDDEGLLQVRSAPSVPNEGVKALNNLEPGPYGGSCGNAVYRNEEIFVFDALKDEKWKNLRELANDFNLKSCWSMPIRSKSLEAMGSFALSSFEHRAPGLFHKKLLESASQIVTIILETEASKAKISMHNRQMRIYTKALSQASEGMLITDADNNIIEFNYAFEKISGYSREKLLGQNPKLLASGAHDERYYKQMWHELHEYAHWKGEFINRNKSGALYTVLVSINVIYNAQEKLYMAMYTDISEISEARHQIESLAYFDGVTKLLNKTALLEELEKNRYTQMMLMNINNFSQINTAYGFDIGNALLRIVAQELNSLCKNGLIFSVYADEFALISNANIDLEKHIENTQKYFQNKALIVDGISFNITFSFGATQVESALFQTALIALKKAQIAGSNRYYIYDDIKDANTQSGYQEFMSNNEKLHLALLEDRIVPYFQGIRNNVSGEIDYYEALVRIVDQTEVMSPYMFLKQAKISGCLHDITKIMIDKSFKIFAPRTEKLSLNITEDDLNRNYLIEHMKAKLLEYKMDASRITLEILEGVSSQGRRNNIRQLHALKSLGFKVAIDDFGAEYSNFERLVELDIDTIKIDARYIKSIDVDTKSQEIVKAIVQFATNMSITTVAEFVHCASVQAFVESIGIEYSQGYYFSEPKEAVKI